MCDSETMANGEPTADQDLSMEMDADTAATLLHQTTQSLLMASNMMLVANGGAGIVSDGKLTSAAIPPSPSAQVVAAINNHVKVNVEELIRENYALREKLKEVSADRDRLVCEVSNLRLELDMSELKRLPHERYVPTP